MTIRNQTGTRFWDEIRIISPWARYLAVLVFLLVPELFVVLVGIDRHPPPFAIRALLGVIAATLLASYVVLVGYVNQDAGRRGMSRPLWTLIAIFVPNGLGIVLYFILRNPRRAHCSQCEAEVEPSFSFCPRCRNRLQPACPHCQHSVAIGDKFCPYCSGALDQTAAVLSPAATSQP
jgi:hypothetical protein